MKVTTFIKKTGLTLGDVMRHEQAGTIKIERRKTQRGESLWTDAKVKDFKVRRPRNKTMTVEQYVGDHVLKLSIMLKPPANGTMEKPGVYYGTITRCSIVKRP